MLASRIFRRFSAAAPASGAAPGPLKLAIIGAGPSGLYAASRLLAQHPPNSPLGSRVEVHVYERLPTPHGLVRYGVAPDHPEVKNVQHKFDLLMDDPRFHFFGNTSIGAPSVESSYAYPHARHLSLSALLPHYTHLLLSYGASLSSPLSHVPGSASSSSPLGNVHPALSFVGWYNGHPSCASLAPDLSDVGHVSVIGQGNVALDCARFLLKGADALKDTDLPESVLEVLRASRVEIVDVVGRRGPGQVAFTTKEFREMLALPNVHFAGVDKALLEEAEAEVERIGGPEARMRKRLLGLMAKGNSKSGASPASLANPQKTFRLSFLRSPISFNSNSVEPSTPILRPRVSSITYGLNALLAPPVPTVSWTPPHQPAEQPAMTLAIPTGEKVEVRTDMVIESVGYRSEPIGEAGLIPFDNRKGRVRNVGGRVVDEEGLPLPNVYASGWVSRGPIGVIASTMYDSYSTMDLLVSDHLSAPSHSGAPGPLNPTPLSGPPPELLQGEGKRVVSYDDWKKIEASERVEGEKRGKRAEKIVDVDQMLGILGA